MNISGIRTCAEFYDYNTIKNNEIRSQQIQGAEARKDQSALEERLKSQESGRVEESKKPDYGAREYAKQYQPDVTYDLKGVDSDITNLDVEKAVSDMKKDQVLQQYQFFIGEKKVGDSLNQTRANENFSL